MLLFCALFSEDFACDFPEIAHNLPQKRAIGGIGNLIRHMVAAINVRSPSCRICGDPTCIMTGKNAARLRKTHPAAFAFWRK